MRLLIVGAGGHAKVVLDAARECGHEIAGVIGDPDKATSLAGHAVTHDPFAIDADGFIAAIGDNAQRAHEFERLTSAGLTPVCVIHPSAVLARTAHVGAGVFVAAGVIVNIDARIGDNAILNTGCCVDHDCDVGAHSLIGPAASLCGGVRVGEGTLIGAGAALVPCVEVGAWSVVGAGAAVVAELPERTVCAGVPAVVLRHQDGPPAEKDPA